MLGSTVRLNSLRSALKKEIDRDSGIDLMAACCSCSLASVAFRTSTSVSTLESASPSSGVRLLQNSKAVLV